MIPILNAKNFDAAIAELSARDADLGRVVDDFGAPTMRARSPGFATLVLLILEQQVSLASAEATYRRLSELAGEVSAGRILDFDDEALRSVGLSRQKTRYVRVLAQTVVDGDLDVEALAGHDDEMVRAALIRITGIGVWTANIYLLSALARPDVWPANDLALAVAAHEIKGLGARPDAKTLDEMGEAWRPYRAVAARILWHYYLNTKRNKGGGG